VDTSGAAHADGPLNVALTTFGPAAGGFVAGGLVAGGLVAGGFVAGGFVAGAAVVAVATTVVVAPTTVEVLPTTLEVVLDPSVVTLRSDRDDEELHAEAATSNNAPTAKRNRSCEVRIRRVYG